ncbi:hypothetical protein E2C01_093414 [Portunus trituberculatus]|uniref:Uncharacterized protein n=1 Tax=Portunus trituberculatus TaxID=210409 RepID=A0A5B7K0F8_PORTR|nr:hypothetical protein [Portunus trituberculatus]
MGGCSRRRLKYPAISLTGLAAGGSVGLESSGRLSSSWNASSGAVQATLGLTRSWRKSCNGRGRSDGSSPLYIMEGSARDTSSRDKATLESRLSGNLHQDPNSRLLE